MQIIVNIVAADMAVNMKRIGSVVVPEPHPFGNSVQTGSTVSPEVETVLVDDHIVKGSIVMVNDVNFFGRSGNTADFLGERIRLSRWTVTAVKVETGKIGVVTVTVASHIPGPNQVSEGQ